MDLTAYEIPQELSETEAQKTYETLCEAYNQRAVSEFKRYAGDSILFLLQIIALYNKTAKNPIKLKEVELLHE